MCLWRLYWRGICGVCMVWYLRVVGGLVCGCWIGAEMCVSRSLVSSESMSVLCMVGT